MAIWRESVSVWEEEGAAGGGAKAAAVEGTMRIEKAAERIQLACT